MREALQLLLDALERQKRIEEQSPAGRALEQRDIDGIAARVRRGLERPEIPVDHNLSAYKSRVRELMHVGNQAPLDAGQLVLVATDAQEAHLLLVRAQTFLERKLADSGEPPDPALIRLQHDIAAKLNDIGPPF